MCTLGDLQTRLGQFGVLTEGEPPGRAGFPICNALRGRPLRPFYGLWLYWRLPCPLHMRRPLWG